MEKEDSALQGWHVVNKYFIIQHIMSPPLYVFETVLPDGSRTRGTAGLPYNDMVRLKSYYDGVVIVKAPAGTPRLQIVSPVY